MSVSNAHLVKLASHRIQSVANQRYSAQFDKLDESSRTTAQDQLDSLLNSAFGSLSRNSFDQLCRIHTLRKKLSSFSSQNTPLSISASRIATTSFQSIDHSAASDIFPLSEPSSDQSQPTSPNFITFLDVHVQTESLCHPVENTSCQTEEEYNPEEHIANEKKLKMEVKMLKTTMSTKESTIKMLQSTCENLRSENEKIKLEINEVKSGKDEETIVQEAKTSAELTLSLTSTVSCLVRSMVDRVAEVFLVRQERRRRKGLGEGDSDSEDPLDFSLNSPKNDTIYSNQSDSDELASVSGCSSDLERLTNPSDFDDIPSSDLELDVVSDYELESLLVDALKQRKILAKESDDDSD
ncbi:hypothetical protein P9112_011293 [Eukaryota sp. TZLM1-RC]